MTYRRDIQGLLDLWLNEGSTVAPDSVIDVVADRIERQRQRGAWRYARRQFQPPGALRFAAAAAALALVGAAGIYLAGSPAPIDVSPSPRGSVPVSPSPSPYVLPTTVPDQTPHTVTSTEAPPRFRIDLPVGWSYAGNTLAYGPDDDRGGILYFRSNPVLGSTCPDQRTAAPTAGPAMQAGAIVAALLADPRLTVELRPAVVLDGRSAQVLDVHLAPGFTGTCYGTRSALIFDKPGFFVVLEGDQPWRLIVLDVDGIPEVVIVWPHEEADDVFIARAMALLEDLTFLP